MDASISDYLMKVEHPLNRYILDIGFLRVDLGTSLGQSWRSILVLNLVLDLVLDLIPGSQYPQILEYYINSQSNGRMNRLYLNISK